MPTHTIAENLTRLQNAKTAIAGAITTAGGTVNSGDGLEDFATDIGTIPGGSTEILAIQASSSVTIPAGVTGIADQGFKNSSVVTITFPNSLTTIGDEAFYGCTSLMGPMNFANTGLTTIGDYAFYHSQVSTDPEDPESFQIDWSRNLVTTIGDHAFDGSNITSVPVLYNNNLVTIGDYAFYGCTDMSYTMYGALIGTGVTTIGAHAFDGVTIDLDPDMGQLFSLNGSLTTIGDYAFKGCLTDITGQRYTVQIPSSVTTIGAHAFDGCTGITSIIVHKASGSITGAPWGASNATVTWTG